MDIQIGGVDPTKGGTLIVRLHDKETWGDAEDALRTITLPITEASTYQTTFHAVPIPKEYALQVLHDENGNGAMDLRWLPWPKPLEGGGFSNGYIPSGKPKYKRAAFAFDSTMTVEIDMSYR